MTYMLLCVISIMMFSSVVIKQMNDVILMARICNAISSGVRTSNHEGITPLEHSNTLTNHKSQINDAEPE